MPILSEVVARLRGKHFGSFDSYRRAFWKEMATELALMRQFDSFGRAQLREGLAPKAPKPGVVGGRTRWELDHIEPLWKDGALYDAENLQLMTPKSHVDKTKEDMKGYSR